MQIYAVYFLIPVLIWLAVVKLYFHYKFTWAEMGIQALGSVLVICGVFAMAGYSATYDTQLINGVVTETNAVKKNCQSGWHDYSDSFCTEYRTRQKKTGQSCSTDSNGRKSCHDTYKTQYKSIYPWERRYFVETDIKYSYEISREDSQGVTYPQRFNEVKLGDPVTVQKEYVNYIKAAASSLFNKTPPADTAILAYPKIVDYYRANRVIITGYSASNALYNEWNTQLAQLNANIRKTGANVIIVVTNDNVEYPEMLARAWDAHNINDVIVTIGMSGEEIAYADVRSWSDKSLVNVEITDHILNLNKLDPAQINQIIETAITDNFKLKPMTDFEYLAEEIPAPTWSLVLAALILLIVTPGVTYLFHKHDVM